MADLGSAAVGTAGALSSVVGHSFHKDKRRRAASARPARKGRSRSPGDEPQTSHAVTAERAAKAPIFVDPSNTPDGVQSNAERVFNYLAHIEKVINDHADVIEAADAEEEFLRNRLDAQALEMANMRSVIAKADADSKAVLESNDAKLKGDMEVAFQKVWDFLAQNNAGIAQMFGEADAAVAKLARGLEELKADEANKPSNVATGPRGLAFMSIRADVKKLGEKVDTPVYAVHA